MKKIFILVFTLFSVSTLFAKINIAVSITPQQTFVEKIGGDKVNVTTMVKPGSDPHSYEPKPSQMIAISKADIYFPIKIEFENAWLEKFKEQNDKMEFIQMTKGIEFINMPKHGNLEDKYTKENLPYEWAGVFKLTKGKYTWSFDKIGGKYADSKMRFLMIKANNKSKNLIEAYKDKAIKIFESETNTARNGDNLDANEKTYELHFDQNKNKTAFKITIKEDGEYIFFTEHMPFEFEYKEHFLKDLSKNDVEPIYTHTKSNGHHHHHDFDPHTWVSPLNVRIMAKNIFGALIKKDPENTNYYRKNYKKFLDEINETNINIKKILLNTPKGSKFMVFHPSWGYFAKEYDLVQLTIEIEGKEPKPKMLSKIIDKAKNEGIKAIFAQKEFSDRSAKAIANELEIKVIKGTPLAASWSDNLIKMAKAIANN